MKVFLEDQAQTGMYWDATRHEKRLDIGASINGIYEPIKADERRLTSLPLSLNLFS